MIDSSKLDILKECELLLSPTNLSYYCSGSKDQNISSYIISTFTVRHKTNYRLKSKVVELTEDKCRQYDLSFIRTNYWSRLKIDMNVQSKIPECMIQNIESNSDLASCTSSTSINASIGANILASFRNEQTMITDETIESTNDTVPDNDEEGGSIKPDELYLVGDIEAGILVRPTVNESDKSLAKGTFNNLIYNFWLQTKETNEEYNIRLVTIYLNNLLSDSVINSFSFSAANEVIHKLNTVVHKKNC